MPINHRLIKNLWSRQMRALVLTLAVLPIAAFAEAPAVKPLVDRDGWRVIDSVKPYGAMVEAVKAATMANKMGVVTEAGPTDAAAKLGVILPGNRVIGVFAPQYAVRILPLSTAAMIEAPIRFYVTEDADGTSTLAWKTPSFIFAPYLDEGGAALDDVVEELDAKFEDIAKAATAN